METHGKKLNLTQLKTRSTIFCYQSKLSSQRGGACTVSPACISSMCFVVIYNAFIEATCFVQPLDCAFFTPHPFPPLFSTDISMWQVPGAIDIGAHFWKVQVYQPWEWLTLSRDWLYQNWEPLDILGTHLHCTLSDAVVNIHKTGNGIFDFIKWVDKINWPL